MKVPAKFEVRSFTCSWDNSDWIFGPVALQSREREAQVVGNGTTRNSVPIGPP